MSDGSYPCPRCATPDEKKVGDEGNFFAYKEIGVGYKDGEDVFFINFEAFCDNCGFEFTFNLRQKIET